MRVLIENGPHEGEREIPFLDAGERIVLVQAPVRRFVLDERPREVEPRWWTLHEYERVEHTGDRDQGIGARYRWVRAQ